MTSLINNITLSNTIIRIISAVVLLVGCITSLYLGNYYTIGFIGIFAILVIYEINVNFFKSNLFNKFNIFSILLFIFTYFLLNYSEEYKLYFLFIIIIAVVQNLFLSLYLFFVPQKEKGFKCKTYCLFLTSVYVFLPIMSIATLLHNYFWLNYFFLLIVVNFSMDTGAWLIGKNLGKTALWPSVSPNKSVEGLIGGMIFSGLFGFLFMKYRMNMSNLSFLIVFFIMGGISQLGDLIQSKFKREFKLKDSSRLIPGHGGVYDRIDSILFLGPFFALMVQYINLY